MLKNMYFNSNKEHNARRVYSRLCQERDQSFNLFYFEFKKQFSYLRYDQQTLMNDLKNKIFISLKETLSHIVIRFDIIIKLKKYLQQIDNQQRNLSAEKKR